MFRAAVLGVVCAKAAADCPGSPAFMHAKQQVKVEFSENGCKDVRDEMLARIAGKNGWVDPHNRGTYSLDGPQPSDSFLKVKRLTGDKKYTDKMLFKFEGGQGTCQVTACSESQVFSVLDFSTNFCNMHDLYAGSQDGCPVAEKDLKYTETVFGGSSGAGYDKSKCVVKQVSRSLYT
eukprot:gb/GFBE01065535.1/.p1 GENE.gb/GFBE01065535.1/~~gb/GFBE01065535.1/.p1  ORF type:complete len:177 (+),score=58.32 gb/GFBE01065535.1/:1-531(+)